MRTQAILAIDAGGTSIKYTLLRFSDLAVQMEPRFFAVPVPGTRDELLSVFEAVFRDADLCAREQGSEIICLALSVPGPFDCTAGISLMKHK